MICRFRVIQMNWFLASVVKYRIYSMHVIQLGRGIKQEGIATETKRLKDPDSPPWGPFHL